VAERQGKLDSMGVGGAYDHPFAERSSAFGVFTGKEVPATGA
jgi:hypothetical protein